ncbi:MAG TPA: CopG family transcriptional regulator [Thermoanaerobaculia bacterium]|nr:CopG family transcriptional regulator [Thermoanaerobaculia bacterium]
MKRITIKLPDDVDAKLRHEAAHRGITVAAIVREAIKTHLSAQRIEEIIRREKVVSPSS